MAHKHQREMEGSARLEPEMIVSKISLLHVLHDIPSRLPMFASCAVFAD